MNGPVDQWDNNILHYIARSENDQLGFLNIALKYASKESINKQNKEGKTPLMHAFEAKNLRLFELLLEVGADTSVIDKDSQNIVHLTVEHPEFLSIALKLSSKEAINAKNKVSGHKEGHQGDTPLRLALEAKNAESFKLLLKFGANVNCSNRFTKDEHILTEVFGESITWVVDNGVDANFINEKGQNILHLKSHVGNRNKEYFKYLTKETINGKDQDGNTALMCVFEHTKDLDKINDLLEHGADISITNNNGENIFHLITNYTEYYGNQKTSSQYLELIVKGNINQNTKDAINAVDKNGNTPLIIAMNKKDKELFKKLIENGADITNQNGKHVYNFINDMSSFSIIKESIEENETVKTELVIALEKNNQLDFQKLVEEGADVSAINSYGQNIFHLIAANYYGHRFFKLAAKTSSKNLKTALNKQDI